MKILLLTSSFPAENTPFLGIFVKDLAEYLKEYGHTIHIVAPASIPDECEQQLSEHIIVHYFKYPGYKQKVVDAGKKLSILPTLVFLLSMFFHAGKIVRKIHIDIIHCYWLIPSGFIGILLKKIFRIPVVATTPGSDINVWSYKTIPRLFIRYTLRHLDYLFALGQQLKTAAVRLGISADKVLVTLGNGGINPNVFPYQKKTSSLRKALNIPAEDFVAIFVGRLATPKRLDLLFPLLKNFNKLWLVVVGNGQFLTHYQELTQQYRIATRVLFIGIVPHENLAEYYAMADVMLYPSEHEGVPSAIREALCMGLPVIASNVGGIPDIIQHGKTGFLTKNSSSSFKSALQMYIQCLPLQAQMRTNCRDFAYKYLIKTRIMPQIIRVYTQVTQANM